MTNEEYLNYLVAQILMDAYRRDIGRWPENGKWLDPAIKNEKSTPPST